VSIALLYIVTGIASVFIDGGLSSALVQRQTATHEEESSVFWFNVAIGLAMAIGLWTAAPWLASLFEVEVLEPLARTLCVSLFVNSLGTIHMTLLSKNLQFRTTATIGIVATIISAIIAITMASLGYGVWALAAQILTASVA
jgi:O-antigen/teichoic acid export membrane protein